MDIIINSTQEWIGKDNGIEYTKLGTLKKSFVDYSSLTKVSIDNKVGSEKALVLETTNETIELAFLKANTSNVNKIIDRIIEINPDCVSEIIEKRRKDEELKIQIRNQEEELNKILSNKDYLSIIVTTCDLKEDYEIIGPVYFQINDSGNAPVFGSLIKEYKDEINEWKAKGQGSNDRENILEAIGLLINLFDGPNLPNRDFVGNSHAIFDVAFFIGLQELKKRAMLLGADAIIGMKQDIDLDTHGFQHFYLQMYGTAVKRK